MTDWSYGAWPSGEPYEWMGNRHDRPDDQLDFHVDLGCGKVKKGRIGVDRFPAPGVNVVADLDRGKIIATAPEPGADAVQQVPSYIPASGGGHGHDVFRWYYGTPTVYDQFIRGIAPEGRDGRLPFETNSISSMVSHHALEHLSDGFIALMDDVWRVLQHGAPFRVIVPLFPSRSAVEDPDHRRWFMEDSFDAFGGDPGGGPMWCESFSVPYTKARFEITDKDSSPPAAQIGVDPWSRDDRRELRVTLRAIKE